MQEKEIKKTKKIKKNGIKIKIIQEHSLICNARNEWAMILQDNAGKWSPWRYKNVVHWAYNNFSDVLFDSAIFI